VLDDGNLNHALPALDEVQLCVLDVDEDVVLKGRLHKRVDGCVLLLKREAALEVRLELDDVAVHDACTARHALHALVEDRVEGAAVQVRVGDHGCLEANVQCLDHVPQHDRVLTSAVAAWRWPTALAFPPEALARFPLMIVCLSLEQFLEERGVEAGHVLALCEE
jgi:hypothetical protein